MALWEVRAVFTYGDRHWENVWEVDSGVADDLDATIIDAFKTFHQGLLLSTYTLEKIVRRPAGSHDAFIESIYNELGTRAVGSSEPLPLFDTFKLFLGVSPGRPGLKYLRGLLFLADVVAPGGVLGSGVVASVETAFAALLAAVIDAGAQIIVSGSKTVTVGQGQASVQMRQLHRKRKKTP